MILFFHSKFFRSTINPVWWSKSAQVCRLSALRLQNAASPSCDWLNWNFKGTNWRKDCTETRSRTDWSRVLSSHPSLSGALDPLVFLSSTRAPTSTLVTFISASGNDSELSVGWKKETEAAAGITDGWCYQLINAGLNVKGRRFKRIDAIKRGLSPVKFSSPSHFITVILLSRIEFYRLPRL